MAEEPSGHARAKTAREFFEFQEERLLRLSPDAGFGEEGGGIGIGLIFILTRQAGGEHRCDDVGKPCAAEGDEAPQDGGESDADRVLSREVDHPTARMAKGYVTELVGDDGGHLGACDLARFIFVEKATGYEDASVRSGQAVDRFNLVDMHPDARQIQGLCHLFVETLKLGVGEAGGLLIECPRGVPGGKLVHHKPVDQGKKDRGQLQHVSHMGAVRPGVQ